MPQTLITENEIKSLFEEAYRQTEGFQKLDPELLTDNPKQVLIFRLAMGMSQNEFEKLLGANSKNTSKYELGKIKKMQFSTAENIAMKLASKLKPKLITLEGILERFRKSANESNGWFRANSESSKALRARRKGAVGSLQLRSTQQEDRIARLLSKKGYKFHKNYPLKDNIIVDFYLPDNRCVIECKEIKSTVRREFKEQVRFLALQGFKVKFNVKNVTIFGLIESKQKIYENDIQELQAFDKVFTDLVGLKSAF